MKLLFLKMEAWWNNCAFVFRFSFPLLEGVLRLKTSAMATDYRPIDSECDCLVCKNYSRAHLHAKITKVCKK